MTNEEKIERYKNLYIEKLDVNCERWPAGDQTRVFEIEGVLRLGAHYLSEVIDNPNEWDESIIEMLLKAQIELGILPNYSGVKGNKSRRTSNEDLKVFTGLAYFNRMKIHRILHVQPAFNRLYPKTKLKPIDKKLYKSFDCSKLKLYNLFRPFFQSDSINLICKFAALNFDEKGYQYTNGHVYIRVNADYVKTLEDGRKIYENSGTEKGCFIYHSKDKFKKYIFPSNHEAIVQKLPFSKNNVITLSFEEVQNLILLLEQMEYFNAWSVAKSVMLCFWEARIDVSVTYLKHILHILSAEGVSLQFSVGELKNKKNKEKGVIAWSSLVISTDLQKFTQLEASGALIMPVHLQGNEFKINLKKVELLITS